MIRKGANVPLTERHEEFLALINMIEYTVGAAASLAAESAAKQLEIARKRLLTELQSEVTSILSTEEISQLATRAGHC
jgi:hypothetical protein